MGFGKNFAKGFQPAYQRGTELGAANARQRLRAKLRREEKIADEERELARSSKREDALLSGNTKEAIKYGASAADIKEFERVRREEAIDMKDSDAKLLQQQLSINAAAKKQQMSVAYPQDAIDAATRQGIDLRTIQPTDINRLQRKLTNREIVRSRSALAAEQLTQSQRANDVNEQLAFAQQNMAELLAESNISLRKQQSVLINNQLEAAEFAKRTRFAPSQQSLETGQSLLSDKDYFNEQLGGTGKRSAVERLMSLSDVQFGGVFRNLAELTAPSGRKIQPEDLEGVATILEKKKSGLSTKDIAADFKKNGKITEQELNGYRAIRGKISTKQALKEIGLTEEDVDKTFSRTGVDLF